jgi:hypothetical protein
MKEACITCDCVTYPSFKMTSALESASSLFGDSTAENSDFFGCLETTGEVDQCQEVSSVREHGFSELAPAQADNFTGHHQHSSGEQLQFSATFSQPTILIR